MTDLVARRRFKRRKLLRLHSGVWFTVRDQYSTPLAAGSVNGTLSEPTGQVRTVTDGNSKLSITGGKLSFATGGVGGGNPGLWYPSNTRTAGRMLFATIVLTANAVEFGYDTDQSGLIAFAIRPIIGNSLGINDNGSTRAVGAQPSGSGAVLQMCIIMRATGCFYFIKGDVYGASWLLIWISIALSANLFPGVTGVGTSSVFTVDDMRMANNLYMPAPIVYDTFTRADGALGSSEIVSPDEVAIYAREWFFTTSIWTISTNKAIATPALGTDVIINGGFGADTNWSKGANWTIPTPVATGTVASSDLSQTVAPLTVGRWYQAAYTVSGFAAGTVQTVLGGISFPTHNANATYTETGRAGTTAFLMRGAGFTGNLDNVSAKLLITAELVSSIVADRADVIADVAVTLSAALNGLQAGLVLNLDSATTPLNFILCYLDGRGNCVLEECVAGTYTNKFTTAITYSAGAILRVIRNGTSCAVFYNNAAVSTIQTMTANTNVNHGLFSTSASNSLDSFALWAYGRLNEYGNLDVYAPFLA